MHQSILHLPILTTLFALGFSALIFRRYLDRGRGLHLLWWSAGILIYGVGTFTESYVTLFGWSESIFRAWYITGALLGGVPLAQGTVYLLLRRTTAHRMTLVLLPVIVVAAIFVLLTPLDYALVESHGLSGKIILWRWVRFFSPFINTYAFVFLVGGALLSARRYRKNPETHARFIGNVFIAVGALLPGIGGTFTRLGYTEVLYVTELVGLVLIFVGYRYNIGDRDANHRAVPAAELNVAAPAGRLPR